MRISMMMAVSAGLAMVLSACGGGSGGTGTGGGSSTSATTGTSTTSTASTTTAATSTSGTGGATSSTTSTSSGSCTPKTCLTLAVEIAADAGVNDPMPDACGILSDGCANFIDCGGCDNPDQACGKGYPTDCADNPACGKPAELPGVPSLCGGGCTLQQSDQGFCSTWPGYSLYICTNKTTQPPKALVPQCQTIFVPGMPSDSWCCP